MRIILVLSMFLLAACNMEVDVQINGEKNEELAQSWMDHLLIYSPNSECTWGPGCH